MSHSVVFMNATMEFTTPYIHVSNPETVGLDDELGADMNILDSYSCGAMVKEGKLKDEIEILKVRDTYRKVGVKQASLRAR